MRMQAALGCRRIWQQRRSCCCIILLHRPYWQFMHLIWMQVARGCRRCWQLRTPRWRTTPPGRPCRLSCNLSALVLRVHTGGTGLQALLAAADAALADHAARQAACLAALRSHVLDSAQAQSTARVRNQTEQSVMRWCRLSALGA